MQLIVHTSYFKAYWHNTILNGPIRLIFQKDYVQLVVLQLHCDLSQFYGKNKPEVMTVKPFVCLPCKMH